MRASEHFSIQRWADDDWFDAILDTDTKLFVDPFLVFKDRDAFWADAHGILIAHFNTCFRLIADSGRNRESLAYQKALALLHHREPKETCLGYTAEGTQGSGGGEGRAKAIARAIEDAIGRGITSLRHFEELGIFNEGIGPDGISDLTCTILKPKLIAYTQAVAARHGLPTEAHGLYPVSYDAEREMWSSGDVALPTNPFTDGPVVLVPQRFLRALPTLNAEDWWTSFEADQVRTNFNYEVLGRVDKHTIVDAARRSLPDVEAWTRAMEDTLADPYDLERDPDGVYQWDKASRDFVDTNPVLLTPPQSLEEFFGVIELVIRQYRLFVEDGGGWRLLWNDDGKEKSEEAAQLVFSGIAKSHCRANGIVVDREVQLGRGPVDFKFSNGFARRALLEVKKVHNSKFWNGLELQLPSYCKSDDCENAWFVALQYREDKKYIDRARELPARVRALAEGSGLQLRYDYIDARPKESASKLT